MYQRGLVCKCKSSRSLTAKKSKPPPQLQLGLPPHLSMQFTSLYMEQREDKVNWLGNNCMHVCGVTWEKAPFKIQGTDCSAIMSTTGLHRICQTDVQNWYMMLFLSLVDWYNVQAGVECKKRQIYGWIHTRWFTLRIWVQIFLIGLSHAEFLRASW